MTKWNDLDTGKYEGILAQTIVIPGHGDKPLWAYDCRPLGVEKVPGVVLIPHMPGWDEFYRETARRFAAHGYHVVCPDIFRDFGTGNPVEVAAAAREAGGTPDETVMADCKASLQFLNIQPDSNGKVGVIGTCSGGRHAFLAACTVEGFSAAVDCWGGGVVAAPEEATAARPVAPIEYAEKLSCPLLGIFGNDDRNPTKEAVDELEAKLKELHKEYQFFRYDGAGHGFWYYHSPMYRQEQAMDSWEKVLTFFEEQLKDEGTKKELTE